MNVRVNVTGEKVCLTTQSLSNCVTVHKAPFMIFTGVAMSILAAGVIREKNI